MMFILITSLAFGSEKVSKGVVLSEDSYVFSLDEAEALKEKIQRLENIEKQFILYKELSHEIDSKNELLLENIEYYKVYSGNLEKMNDNNQLIIDKYMRKENLNNFRLFGYFAAGLGLAFGSVYAAAQLG